MEEDTNQIAPESADISISDVLSRGWALLNEYMKTWAGLALVVILPTVAIYAIFNALIEPKDVADSANDLGDFGVLAGGALITVVIVSIYQLIISAILFSVYIKVAGGQKLEGVSQALSLGTAKAGKVIVASIVVGVIIGFGFVLLIIPGIIAIFLLAATVYIVADTELSLSEAMSLSVQYAKQFFVQILLLGLVLFIISIAVAVVTSLFNGLPYILFTLIDTTTMIALQVFGGISAAVLYLEMKKRYKAPTV